jgi:hypothetical protein
MFNSELDIFTFNHFLSYTDQFTHISARIFNIVIYTYYKMQNYLLLLYNATNIREHFFLIEYFSFNH